MRALARARMGEDRLAGRIFQHDDRSLAFLLCLLFGFLSIIFSRGSSATYKEIVANQLGDAGVMVLLGGPAVLVRSTFPSDAVGGTRSGRGDE